MVSVIDDNVRVGRRKQKYYETEVDRGRQRPSRDHIVRQTVSTGGSGDCEGQGANGRQFGGWHQLIIDIRLRPRSGAAPLCVTMSICSSAISMLHTVESL